MYSQFEFAKYQGAGNDFVMLNGFKHSYENIGQRIVAHLCHRNFGIGADGLIVIKPSETADFAMDYYNSDGKPGSLCGNGARCAVAFAHKEGVIAGSRTRFEAYDGIHVAEAEADSTFTIYFKSPGEFVHYPGLGMFVNTGSPHLVVKVENVKHFDVYNEGRRLRHHPEFKPGGTNVNFYSCTHDQYYIRTFERGVENETMACGTGTVATALSIALEEQKQSPIELYAPGGLLKVRFKNHNGDFTDISLNGDAKKVFTGTFAL